MAKSNKQYICQSCGSVYPKWIGKCEQCNEWNTLLEEKNIKHITSLTRDKHKISSDIFKCQSKMLAAWKQGVVTRILGPVFQIHVLVCFNASFCSNVYAVQCACTAALLQRDGLKHLSALPSVLPKSSSYLAPPVKILNSCLHPIEICVFSSQYRFPFEDYSFLWFGGHM